MNWGFPLKSSKNNDLQLRKAELIEHLRESEKLWSQREYIHSIDRLRKAIQVIRFLADQSTSEPVRTVLKDKLRSLEVRYSERVVELQAQQANICHTQLPKPERNRQIEQEFAKKGDAPPVLHPMTTPIPTLKWQDIVGLDSKKKALQEAITLPLIFPEIFTGARSPWKGVLLYGPPGTGKTCLANGCTTNLQLSFFSVSQSELMSKFVGDGERQLKHLFNAAYEQQPSVIFIDEIDTISSRHQNWNANRRIKTEFLVQMQSILPTQQRIVVVSTTNVPWDLDPAIRRRFQRRIPINLPNLPARYKLIQNLLRDVANNVSELLLHALASSTQGYNWNEIQNIVRSAVLQQTKKGGGNAAFFNSSDPAEQTQISLPGYPSITVEDIQLAITKTKPSITKLELARYDEFDKEFGQEI